MRSDAHILLELFEAVAQQGQVAVDLFGVADQRVDLGSHARVLCLLGDQIAFAEWSSQYIFYSNILTSISSFVFDYSVVCLPSFSVSWNSAVSDLRDCTSRPNCVDSFLVCSCVIAGLPRLSRALRRRCFPSPRPRISSAMSFCNLLQGKNKNHRALISPAPNAAIRSALR